AGGSSLARKSLRDATDRPVRRSTPGDGGATLGRHGLRNPNSSPGGAAGGGTVGCPGPRWRGLPVRPASGWGRLRAAGRGLPEWAERGGGWDPQEGVRSSSEALSAARTRKGCPDTWFLRGGERGLETGG